jgi:hypothetical protein
MRALTRMITALALLVVLLAALTGPTGLDAAPGQPTVDYRGLRLPVPAGWPVTDLSAHPGTCARVDHHAIYLGTPSAAAACPARITGRTETVTVEPIAGPVPPGTVVAADPARLPARLPDQPSVALPRAGLLVTVTQASDPGAARRLLAGARFTAAARPARVTVRPESVGTAVTVPGTFTGYGFDACQAPSSAAMDGWLSSPYRAIGVYLGGGDLGCPNQPNLTPDWVARQAGRGWHVFPLYVGRQAPCSTQPFRITDPRQGQQDADDAALKARALGMARGSVIYHDMESYKRGSACSTAVLTYLTAWTTTLHANGYRSGVYSSRSAAIDDLTAAATNPAYRMPDHIDFASWDNRATTADPHIPPFYWALHQRIKQYSGGHNENHGGTTINVDSDYLDVG